MRLCIDLWILVALVLTAGIINSGELPRSCPLQELDISCCIYVFSKSEMAPTNSNAGDVADSFSSSLISSLAPLITLFGDQVTKQFLSQVTGWTDTLVFAMAPAGILTGIVSAIRLGGSNSLKALIGR